MAQRISKERFYEQIATILNEEELQFVSESIDYFYLSYVIQNALPLSTGVAPESPRKRARTSEEAGLLLQFSKFLFLANPSMKVDSLEAFWKNMRYEEDFPRTARGWIYSNKAKLITAFTVHF